MASGQYTSDHMIVWGFNSAPLMTLPSGTWDWLPTNEKHYSLLRLMDKTNLALQFMET